MVRGQLAMKASTEAASSAPGVETAKTSSLVRLTLRQIESFEQGLGLIFQLELELELELTATFNSFWDSLPTSKAALAG